MTQTEGGNLTEFAILSLAIGKKDDFFLLYVINLTGGNKTEILLNNKEKKNKKSLF